MTMPEIIEKTMKQCDFISSPSLEDYKNTDQKSRMFAKSMIK